MTVVIDPRRETRDGHHGWLIDEALAAVCGGSVSADLNTWNLAQEELRIGPGTLVVPPGGWSLRSIRNLDVYFDHTTVYGRGQMPAVVEVDGSVYTRFAGTPTFQGDREHGGSRLDVPDNVVLVHMGKGLQQTHFHFEGQTKIGGLWKEAGFRGGHPNTWTTVQEDHYGCNSLQVFGNYDVLSQSGANTDLCRFGVWAGNPAWSNNRRHVYGYVHVAWCETAFRNQQVSATVQHLVADGCREYLMYGGGTLIVNGGEAEHCARLINDIAWIGHDLPCHISHVYAKLGAWKPDMAGVDPTYASTAFGVWGTRGGLYLHDVKVQELPIRRTLVSDNLVRYPDDGPPPRLWTTQPLADITFSGGSTVDGYKETEILAYEPQGSGRGRIECGYKTCTPNGFMLNRRMSARNLPLRLT